MLPTADSFKSSLLALSPTADKLQGITNFVNAISNFTNQIQASSLGAPGILTFGNAAMISGLLVMEPVSDNSWIENFANAWTQGVSTSTIASSTVTDPAVWIGSTVDINTLPSATTTITTIAEARTLLISALGSVGPTSDAPLPLATAIRNATLALKFNCIGLGPPPTFVPIPVLLSAE